MESGMACRIVTTCEGVDWTEVAGLFEKVNWGQRDPACLQRAFERTFRVCFVYQDGRLVAVGRAVSDGEFYATIFDVMVDPAAQRQGLCRTVMQTLLAGLEGMHWIHLTATPGNEPFYQRLGFRRQTTAMAINTRLPAVNPYLE